MIERYLVVAGRIRQEVAHLERVVTRAERAVAAVRQRLDDQDLYLDAAALNLHDFYAGGENSFLPPHDGPERETGVVHL